MCVICYKPKNVEMPTEEKIRAMFKTNPDGAGYAYTGRNGKVYYKKGFMDVDELLNDLQPMERWKNTNLALHFRIGTAGKNDKKTCHPFEVSTNYNDLQKTSGEGVPVLFHNGIIGYGGMVNEHSSDTQDFVVAFAPMLKKYVKSKVRKEAIEDYVNDNKILVMYNNGRVQMYGDFKKDGELYVSNKNYQVNEYKNNDLSWGGWYENSWDEYEEYYINKYMNMYNKSYMRGE